MADLFPTFDAPDIVDTSTEANTVAYGTSWIFDFDAGDFVQDGSGKVQTADGYQAWVQWCVKAVLAERYAYLIYSDDYGVEMENARAQPNRSAIQADIELTITEALLEDPRTNSVEDFAFSWSGDELDISFTIVPTVGTSQRVEVTIGG